jgi:phosphoglycolate phosphatase-like HAD superfamily hydrolase
MMNNIKKKLILYDIDGTLVNTGGAGTRSMNYAFHKLFGIEDAFRDIPMAGKTDFQIMREGLKAHGFPYIDGNVDKMMHGYLEFLQKEISNPHKHLMPGILESLEVLKKMGMSLGLLTGNLEQGASIKLGAFGINRYFLDGAYGSDDEDRDKLLPVAIKKFAEKGHEFAAKDCIVIGDTPRDVQCAKVHGAQCIAVATGPYSKEDLLNTEADIVLDSMENSEQYLGLITEFHL